MKTLIINYRYFISGGHERYMFDLIEILEKQGHEVIPFSIKSSRNIETPYEKYFAEPLGGQDEAEEVQAFEDLADYESIMNEESAAVSVNDEPESIFLASVGSSLPLPVAEQADATNGLKEIISNDLSLDVYFKAGSVDLEKFYSQQLSVISSLLSEIPDLELNLDGYSDRQGDEAENMQLSVARLQSVRNYFVAHGIDGDRIKVNAYGEKNFVSSPGELAAYVFDRRVVVSFTSPSVSTGSNVAAIADKSSL